MLSRPEKGKRGVRIAGDRRGLSPAKMRALCWSLELRPQRSPPSDLPDPSDLPVGRPEPCERRLAGLLQLRNHQRVSPLRRRLLPHLATPGDGPPGRPKRLPSLPCPGSRAGLLHGHPRAPRRGSRAEDVRRPVLRKRPRLRPAAPCLPELVPPGRRQHRLPGVVPRAATTT